MVHSKDPNDSSLDSDDAKAAQVAAAQAMWRARKVGKNLAETPLKRSASDSNGSSMPALKRSKSVVPDGSSEEKKFAALKQYCVEETMFATEAEACGTYEELYQMVLEDCPKIMGDETELKETIEYYMEKRSWENFDSYRERSVLKKAKLVLWYYIP